MDRLLPKPMSDQSQRVRDNAFHLIPAFLIRFSRRVFPVTDEAVESDVALVWCGASALEWVLAWL